MYSSHPYTDHPYNPFCACDRCDHAVQTRASQLNERRGGMSRGREPMWDSCEIRYRIRHADAVRNIDLCDELPIGWVVGTTERVPHDNGGGYSLVFEVQGSPRESDGTIVYRILQRLGAL